MAVCVIMGTWRSLGVWITRVILDAVIGRHFPSRLAHLIFIIFETITHPDERHDYACLGVREGKTGFLRLVRRN
jgi:hypothetical protein